MAFTKPPSSPHQPHPPTHPQAKECMLFSGSAVASGVGAGVVTATGMATEIGKIQSDIQVCFWGGG